MNLQEFRSKYPAYQNVPDDELAGALYNKFYAGKVDRDHFNEIIGYQPAPWYRRAYEGAKSAVVGENEFDFPELAPSMKERITAGGTIDENAAQARLINAVDLPRGVEGQVDAIRKVKPDARFGADKFGNVFVSLDGKNYYLNRSGLSWQDARNVGTEIAFDAPLMVPAGRLSASLLGGMGRYAGVGPGAAAGSMARDAAAIGVGSKQGIDLENAALTGGTAALFEGFGSLASSVLRRVVRSVLQRGGMMTKAEKNMLRKVGIDPDSVTPEFISKYRNLVSDAKPEFAARMAQSETLPHRVPLTRGQVTEDPAQLALESQLKKRGRVDGPNPLLDTQDAAQEALQANRKALQGHIAGTGRQPGEGAAIVQDALLKRREMAREGVSDAYRAAREGNAGFPAQEVKNLGRGIRRDLMGEFDLAGLPATRNILDGLAQIERQFPGRVTTVKVRALETWRKQATRRASVMRLNNPEEAEAIRRAVRAYDEWSENIAPGLVSQGDESAIAAWREAVRMRAKFGSDFESADIVNILTDTLRDGSRRLAVEPWEAADAIFGKANLAAKRGLGRDLDKLRAILGDGAEWQAVREEAFLRLFRTQTPGGPFSGAKFAKELNAALAKPELVGKLFTADEINLLKQFRDVALRTEKRPLIVGDVNPSGTSWGNQINRMLERFGALGRTAQIFAGWGLGRFERSQAEATMRRAASGTLPRREPVLPIGAGVAGPVVVNQP